MTPGGAHSTSSSSRPGGRSRSSSTRRCRATPTSTSPCTPPKTPGRTSAGAWHEFGTDLLLGYEHRACLKLGTPDPGPGEPPVAPATRIEQAVRRVCVDVRTRQLLGLCGYHRIHPPHRLWIWHQDLDTAREELDLIEPEI